VSLCLCGCGNECKPGNKYIYKHYGGRKPGSKQSQETKEKMRLSAIERNKNPEYIQKLKDSHSSKKDPEKWKEMCEANRIRMIEQNPMKDPEISKIVAEKNTKENKKESTINTYAHRDAWELFGKDNCEICGITLLNYMKKLDRRFSMHCRSKDYTDLSEENWMTVCEFGCHQKADHLDRMETQKGKKRKPLSKEHKRKLREAHKRRKIDP